MKEELRGVNNLSNHSIIQRLRGKKKEKKGRRESLLILAGLIICGRVRSGEPFPSIAASGEIKEVLFRHQLRFPVPPILRVEGGRALHKIFPECCLPRIKIHVNHTDRATERATDGRSD